MSMPMLAGVGLLSVCCISSSVAATMMGGGEEDPGGGGGVDPSAGPSAGPSAVPNVLSDPVGTPIQCNANDVGSGANAVYRVEADNVLRHYPNPPIASSWDPDWGTTFKKIDCQGFTQGPAMAAKP